MRAAQLNLPPVAVAEGVPFAAACRDVTGGGPVAKLVLLVLASFCRVYVGAGDRGRCRVSQRRLALAAECSVRALRLALGELRSRGVLDVERTGRASEYVIGTTCLSDRHDVPIASRSKDLKNQYPLLVPHGRTQGAGETTALRHQLEASNGRRLSDLEWRRWLEARRVGA